MVGPSEGVVGSGLVWRGVPGLLLGVLTGLVVRLRAAGCAAGGEGASAVGVVVAGSVEGWSQGAAAFVLGAVVPSAQQDQVV